MIQPSLFLRRAILADAISAAHRPCCSTLGAGALAPLLNLPEALLRETGLFLIAYAALVGWLGTPTSHAEGAGGNRDRGQCGVDHRQHRAVVLRRGDPEPARRSLVAAQAIVVGALAELQFIACAESGGALAA